MLSPEQINILVRMGQLTPETARQLGGMSPAPEAGRPLANAQPPGTRVVQDDELERKRRLAAMAGMRGGR